MRYVAVIAGGLILGAVVVVAGCRFSADIQHALDPVVAAWCYQQLGACGTKSVWWNRCTKKVEVRDQDGNIRENLTTFEIADRPGVEQQVAPPTSPTGAFVTRPKMTAAWMCKKRRGRVYCHIYRAGGSAFGAFVKRDGKRAAHECGRRLNTALCPKKQTEI
jgi:hypothetical protein